MCSSTEHLFHFYRALLTIVSSYVFFNVQFFRVRTHLGVCWVGVYSSDHRNIFILSYLSLAVRFTWDGTENDLELI